MFVGYSEVKEGFPAFSVVPKSANDGHHMSHLVWTLSGELTKGLQNRLALDTTSPIQDHIHQKGAQPMAKSQDSRKETKKQPAKTTKEKRAEKLAKKKR